MRNRLKKLTAVLLAQSAYSVALLVGGTGLALGTPLATTQGPSSSATPYLTPTSPFVSATSLLTVGDTVGGYTMAGIPDGIGAFDNRNGTITVLLNHEIGAGSGVAHGPLGAGAFVSAWTIDKNTLKVLSGSDLITSLNISSGTTSLNRLCSADLAPISAFYNAATGNGYNGQIFMDGEEGGSGRQFGTVANGSGAIGIATQLSRLGTQAWENALVNPGTGDKTVVIENDDTSGNGNGQVFVYVGDKQKTGSEVDKAGLTNGKLYAIKVDGLSQDVQGSVPAAGTSFSLVSLGNNATQDNGDVTGLSVTALNTQANSHGATGFLRPEDGAWNPANPNEYYFVTTDQYDQTKDGVGATIGRSRLWKMVFTDASNPLLGGKVTAVIDGTGPTQMLDNLTISADGIVYLQEDVGANAHNGKIWAYDTKTGKLTQIFQHDPARFGDIGLAATAPFNNDEESSGILDVTSLFTDASWYTPNTTVMLADVQAHYPLPGALVEGGQLLLLTAQVPEPSAILVFLSGIAGLFLLRRRKHASS